jgi:hypothetical protein
MRPLKGYDSQAKNVWLQDVDWVSLVQGMIRQWTSDDGDKNFGFPTKKMNCLKYGTRLNCVQKIQFIPLTEHVT